MKNLVYLRNIAFLLMKWVNIVLNDQKWRFLKINMSLQTLNEGRTIILMKNNLISAKSQVIENGGPTIHGVNSAFAEGMRYSFAILPVS